MFGKKRTSYLFYYTHTTVFSFIYPTFARIKHIKNMKKRLNHILSTVFAVLASIVLSSCDKDIPQPNDSLKENTVIVYMGAENSLYGFSNNDLNEMLLGSKDIPDNCQVVVFRDDRSMPSIFLFNKNGETTWKTYTTDLNSADPATMKSVLKEIIKGFPSKKYSLVLWSHGSGWIDEPNNSRSVIVDNGTNSTANKGSWIEISELAGILASLPHMEYIFFDACYMQSVEVASQLYSYTDYIIGSPTEIPGEGAPYHLIIKSLCLANPQGIIDGYASAYGTSLGVLLSAVSCEDFPEFCTETAKYIPSAFPKDNMPRTAGIQIYAPAYGTSYSTQRAMPVPYDMRSAMHRVLSEEDYTAWEMAWKKAILYPTWAYSWDSMYSPSTHGSFHCSMQDKEHYGGISMHIPNVKYDAKGWNRDFQHTPWYEMTHWKQTGW